MGGEKLNAVHKRVVSQAPGCGQFSVSVKRLEFAAVKDGLYGCNTAKSCGCKTGRIFSRLSEKSGLFPAAVLFAALFFLVPFPVISQDASQQAGQSAAPQVDGVAAEDAPAADGALYRFPGEEAIIFGEEDPAAAVEPVSSGWVVLRMVLVLALAALAIYGVVFFIKRLARPPRNRDPHLKILASVPLGSGAFAAVLSVGARAWLVGGGDGGVNLISEIDEQEALEAMLIDEAQKDAETNAGRFLDFASLLRKMGRKSRGNSLLKDGPENINVFDSHAESLRRQRDRLKGL